jgi:hypothetical protein
MGEDLGNLSAKSVLRTLAERLREEAVAGDHTVAQLCRSGRQSECVFSIAIDTT